MLNTQPLHASKYSHRALSQWGRALQHLATIPLVKMQLVEHKAVKA